MKVCVYREINFYYLSLKQNAIYEVAIYYERVQSRILVCCGRIQRARYLDNNVIDNLRGRTSQMILGGMKIIIQ